MASGLFSSNVSFLSIPLYYGLCIVPHGYAIVFARNGKINDWDNRNPRDTNLKDRLKKELGPAKFARYERAEAAHYNSLESFTLFASAITIGNIARLPVEDLNSYAVGMGVLRAAYIVAYIGWSTQVLWKAGTWLA